MRIPAPRLPNGTGLALYLVAGVGERWSVMGFGAVGLDDALGMWGCDGAADV